MLREGVSGTLSDEERAIYEWQMSVPDFGVAGQEKLKQASVLISRAGGVGGLVAYQLAAAGVGRLIVAHAGSIKPSDLNRQLLMTYDAIGQSRIESVERRLKQLNPRLDVVAVDENVSADNVERLVAQADVVVDCAPLFPERYAMNDEAMRQDKPLVECAMYELEAQLTTFVPGVTGCLRCLVPNEPPHWTRRFPVFGAVSGSVACLAAMETIKLIAGLGQPLLGRLLRYDLRDMTFDNLRIERLLDCPICSHLHTSD
ncbi:MAG: HesA/MoeB/ThiF family protein [Pirellulaceae bacterium]|jgi:molybdopterin/thiamine biosynthesis adenylyltransferase|nr:HesA/MoeB/ThiF family protein [Pirellulaceae bacterium]